MASWKIPILEVDLFAALVRHIEGSGREGHKSSLYMNNHDWQAE